MWGQAVGQWCGAASHRLGSRTQGYGEALRLGASHVDGVELSRGALVLRCQGRTASVSAARDLGTHKCRGL